MSYSYLLACPSFDTSDRDYDTRSFIYLLCRYTLVGETMITALWVGHNYFALYPRDRIGIRRGDVLGVYFPKYNPIPWTAVECRQGNQHLYKYNPYSVTSSMTSSGKQCAQTFLKYAICYRSVSFFLTNLL